MVISDFAIKRPVITIVTMLALSVFGIFALLKLQTDEFPDIAPPFVTVAIPYPGASPDGVATEILDPIEDAIQSVNGVKQVTGKALDGVGIILVEFVFEKPLNEATQDIRDAISKVRNDLPPESKEPIIAKYNDTDRPIVSMALNSNTLSPSELTRLADPDITREFRSIPGVAEVTVTGDQQRELTVELRPDALQAAGVSVAQVVQALQLQNLAAPVGRVEGALDEKTIRLRGRLETPEEFLQLPVTERNGQLIRLGQVADVRDGTEESRSMAQFEGRQAIGIDIKKSRGYSTTAVSDMVRARAAEVAKTLPAGTRLDLVKDSGRRVRAAVQNVEETLFEGALLTVLVVFVFLNSWRSTVITGLALPVSVLAAFIAVWTLGYTLNTMSLLGLSLAIGILIDDAIVVRENIVRHVEMGKSHLRAAHEGTDEIGLAVAATTFSIIAVFVPIAFIGGFGGQWMKPFALTIACAVLVSLFVSFSLDPMLSAYWPDPHQEEHQKGWITRQLDRFNHWFDRRAQDYKRVIGWALDHRWWMSAIAVATFIFALAMPILGLVGSGFVPPDDRSEMTIAIETPPGSNLDYTRLRAQEIAEIVRKHPEVRYTYTTLGGSTTGALNVGVDVGSIFVQLSPKNERALSADEFAEVIRGEVKRLAGVTVAVFTTDIGGGRKQMQFQLRGSDLATLNATAERVKAEVQQVPGAVDVGLSSKGLRPELTVTLRRGVAGSLGITAGQVAQSLRPAFAGIDVGDWEDPSGETRDVTVRFTPEARRRAQDLRQVPLAVGGFGAPQASVPLGQVADVREEAGPAIINHLDRELVVMVEANAAGRPLGAVMQDIQTRLDKLQLPPHVSVTLGGDAARQGEVFGDIFLAMGVAVMLMYLVLVMQFGSFLDPLAIMVSLPLSLIGVMLGLAVTGGTINIMSLIGVLLLMGIVAKNAILLIDFAKWSRERDGIPLREALIEAGSIRLRPILMTTFALIAGMIPVALGRGEGSQFRAPLGVAVIGGVITSTLLTLIVIPTVYEILDDWRSALGRRFGFRAPATAEHRVPAPVPVAGD